MSYSFTPPVTIENTKEDSSIEVVIYIVVSCVVFLLIVISIIVCCYRRCRQNNNNIVQYPDTYGYSVSPYTVQPVVPVVQSNVQQNGITQPYYNSNQEYNQYNQIQVAPSSVGSDVRVEQNPNNEKPA